METYDRHRLERHARRIEELRLWRNAYESPVKGWRFSAGDEAGASGKTYDIEPGDFWPEVGIPVRLSTRTNVPEEWAGLPVELELWLGGEGFVEISVGDSRTASGLNPLEGVELALGSLKRAKDGRGVILRLYEPHGKRGPATLRLAKGVGRAERVDLLEVPEGGVEAEGGQVRFAVRPFEVLTLRLRPEAG